MKKIFTLLLISLAALSANAQCTTTYQPTNNCASFGDRIDAFTLNSIASTGSSGCSTNGYGFFSTPVWTLIKGGVYNFSALVGSGTENQGFAIWIDLDNDGTYANSEMLYSASSPGTSHSSTIMIPFGTASNNNLPMRIRCAYNTVLTGGDGCVNGIGTWGETEDYLVNIVCPSAAPNVSVAATSTHICVGQSVTLTATGASAMTISGGITSGVGFSPSTTTNYTVSGSIAGCTGTTTVVKTISVSTTPLVIAASTSTTSLCAGSTATLTGAGATNYTWLPSGQKTTTITVSPSTSSTYSLVGYNGSGCPGLTTLAINVSPVPTLVAVVTPTGLCSGQVATLSVSGAQTYSWQSPINSTMSTVTVSPQSSVAYPVTGISSNGCSGSTSAIVVTKPSPTTTAVSSKTLICVGSSANLTAGGASTYSWANGPSTASYSVNPVATTVYTVTGIGTNGCTKDTTIKVSVFQATISISNNTSVCSGGAVTLNAGNALAYSWNVTPGNTQQIFITPTVSAMYMLDATVTVNGANCQASNSVSVTVLANPTPTASAIRKIICRGETTTITATGADTYLWNNNQTAASFTVKGSAVQTINYSVTGTDANGCVGTSSTSLKVDLCQSLNEQSESLPFTAYPNPSAGSFNIKAHRAMVIEISNELGQVIRTVSANAENLYSTEVSDLNSGIYFISEQGSDNGSRSKIVVLK